MSFTYVDAVVAVIVLLSAFLAYSRGFTREMFAIGGWLLAALAAFFFAPMVKPLIEEIPYIGPKVLQGSCIISMIAAFVLVVAAGLLVLAVFTPIFASVVLESALGPIDRVLGFLFGVARGVLLIAVAYLIYGYLSVGEFQDALADPARAPETGIEALDKSASKNILDEVSALIDRHRPEELPSWFDDRINALMAPCTDEGGPAAPATEGTTGGSST